MPTGGFADRYGYKKQIVAAVLFKMIGYLLMATQREFWPFLAGCLVLAAGLAAAAALLVFNCLARRWQDTNV